MSFMVGENVGPYRVIEQLGQGGMASVFKAYHPALDRYVAIKVLHPAFKEDPNFLSRFQREARVVARLEHPNIVPIYDFAEHKGQPYLVMKFIDGVTLKARLAQSPLSKDEAVKIVESIGSALSYAHSQGVLHRDIKPSNILLSPDGSIYLADFGLARIAEAGASTLSKDVMLGTPQYISPEQARGARDLDEGTDIYSLGVVLYELVVGRVPFNADTPFSIIHDHIYTPLPLPTKVNPHVPPNVERVLLKALAKSREDRYGSVEELIAAFRAAIGLGPEGTAEGTTRIDYGVHSDSGATEVAASAPAEDGSKSGSRQAEPAKRKRWPWVVAGVVFSAICLFAFLMVVGNSQDAEPTPIEEPATEAPIDEPPPIEDDLRPEAHLRIADDLVDKGRTVMAGQEFLRAGELFLEEGAFIRSAEALLRALQVSPQTLDRNPRAEDVMTEALFLGAPDDGVFPILDRLEEEVAEWPVLPIVRARALLYHDAADEADGILERALARDGEDPLALAVLAEIDLSRGAIDEASAIIGSALEHPDGLPDWLLEHYHWLKSQI